MLVIALLLHGRLEDWQRNPQYVLEAQGGSDSFHFLRGSDGPRGSDEVFDL